jgi:hypothetical protein
METNPLIQGQEPGGNKAQFKDLVVAQPQRAKETQTVSTKQVKSVPPTPAGSQVKPARSVSQNNQVKQKKGVFSITSLLFVLGVIGLVIYSLFLFVGNGTLAEDKASLEIKLDSLRQVEETGEAKATLSTRAAFYRDRDDNRVLWTNIINSMLGSIPQSVSTSARAALALGVVGNDQGTLTLSMESHPDSQEPFFDTAVVLKSLEEQSYLADVFIPSIGVKQNQLGQIQLTYTVNAKLLFEEVTPSLLDDEDLFTDSPGQREPAVLDPESSDALADQVEALRDLASSSEDDSSVTPNDE